MKPRRNQIQAILLALALLFVGTVTGVNASDDGDGEVHVKRIHKVVINCEEGSGEDCERQIHIEQVGDGSHRMHLGDHEMMWIEGGGDGAHHYTFGSGFDDQGGFLGVQLTDLTAELRTHFGVAADEGVMVAKVVDDSAAFRAGLTAGDIITRVDGEAISSSSEMTHAIRSREEGETVLLEIWRLGASETVSATLDKTDQVASGRRHIMVDCDDDEANCGAHFIGRGHHAMAVDCPDGEECEIKVDCDDGDCDCTVNGESIDCEELYSRQGDDD